MSKAWKGTERGVAQALNCRRVGQTGLATPDAVNDWLSVEVKHRKLLPAWLVEAMAQAHRNADEDKLAIVVLHEHGQRRGRDLVVITLADFTEWFGDGGPNDRS